MLKRSHLVAIGLLVAVILWLFSGALNQDEADTATVDTGADRPMAVQVRTQNARPVTREVVVQGQVEPARSVTLRAETAGRVEEVVAVRGRPVAAGTVIARIAMDDREARLRQARATVRQRREEFEAARQLGAEGYQAATRVSAAEAALEAAKAELARIEQDIRNTRIRAPFDGVLNERRVEVGNYLSPGAEVATVIDIDPLIATGDVPQQVIGRIHEGDDGTVRFINGETATGRVRYVSAEADAETRTFRVELTVPNPEGRIAAGLSVELRLPLETVAAHYVSPAFLSLDEQGRLGVKTVDANDKVVFHEVGIVRAEADGVWVSGLPEKAVIITLGQGFVRDGQPVRTVPGDSESAVPLHNAEPPPLPGSD